MRCQYKKVLLKHPIMYLSYQQKHLIQSPTTLKVLQTQVFN